MAKKGLIRPHRNANKLTEDLRANSEVSVRKEISNCIFYLLFVEIYYIIFDVFYPMSPITIKCIIFTFSSIKTEIDQTIKYHQRLIMWQFTVQGGKIKDWNKSCFPVVIKPIHCISYWFAALYYPKSVNACKKPITVLDKHVECLGSRWTKCLRGVRSILSRRFVKHFLLINKK